MKPKASEADQVQIADPARVEAAETYGARIENFIGTVKMPVGSVGGGTGLPSQTAALNILGRNPQY
ncbi:hypothetical protein [Ruegeria halocynthiae]|uniref:hypothetical protein n=1 Tax=Ruegeria halocynthiae TaxID=985054 RepID=UPI00056B71FF|nr:hypothetical protein [Ruegeria halocynthiae]